MSTSVMLDGDGRLRSHNQRAAGGSGPSRVCRNRAKTLTRRLTLGVGTALLLIASVFADDPPPPVDPCVDAAVYRWVPSVDAGASPNPCAAVSNVEWVPPQGTAAGYFRWRTVVPGTGTDAARFSPRGT